jgi:hypothetical protein
MSVSGWEAVLAVPISPGFVHVRGVARSPVSLMGPV